MRLPSKETSGPAPTLTLNKWSYRGEGNANLVIALPDQHVIVRLRKCPPNQVHDSARIWREVEFSKMVMQPLLGDKCALIPDVVWIPPQELRRLQHLLKDVRPAHRYHKNTFSEFAAVFADMCLLPAHRFLSPTFCVEIKPKQGWIPLPDRRLPKCTFCLNQYLKLCHGSVTEQSQYCPLDLFSGDDSRMKFALKALLKCPQNNFKIFRDGCVRYGEGVHSYDPILTEWFGKDLKGDKLVENMCDLVLNALTADGCGRAVSFPQIPVNIPVNSGRISQHVLDKAASLIGASTCYLTPAVLPSNCILSRILGIQKLDLVGSDAAYNLYSSSQQDNYDYVSKIVNDIEKITHPLYAYLLATTAKDCSIMIAFQEASDYDNNRNIVYDSRGRGYVFNIGVSDIDPKPLSCVEKHRKRDLEIVECCIRWLEPRNTEIDEFRSETETKICNHVAV